MPGAGGLHQTHQTSVFISIDGVNQEYSKSVCQLDIRHSPQNSSNFVLCCVTKIITIGSVVAKLYTVSSRKSGRVYDSFIASYYHDGKRYRETASTLEKLEAKVRAAIEPLVGENDSLTMRGSKLRAYERACELANEMGLELDEAMIRFREIHQLAAVKKSSPLEAIEYWSRHHDQQKFSAIAATVVAEFLADRTANNNSAEDVATMRGKLNKFATAFNCPLSEISVEDYRNYFKTLTGSPRNRKNHRDTIHRLLNWAKATGFLAHDHPGLPKFIGKVKVPAKRVLAFDAAQRDRLLQCATAEELPMCLLKAYVPIRQKEAGLVCWENFDWDMGILNVWADEAKTRESRQIHLPRCLCDRLRPLAKPSGRIYPFGCFYKVGPRLAQKAGITWIRNGWRSTVISHLQAAVNDLVRVAEEGGTSVKKLKSNYIKPLRPDIGRAYFSLNLGERHPIEPGYNCEHYGVLATEDERTSEGAGNLIPIRITTQLNRHEDMEIASVI